MSSLLHILALVVFLLCENSGAIRTYYMENYCDKSISMILSSWKQGSIKLDASHNFYHESYLGFGGNMRNECQITLEAWYTWDSIGFYFEHLDLPCEYGYLSFYDGETIMNGLETVCDDFSHNGQYVAVSRRLKIKYFGKQHRSNVMNLIVTAFHEGYCESYEYRCDNGRCIDDDLSCNPYNSCGDGDNCRLSGGTIAGIVIGALAGVTVIVIIVVMVCCCNRRRNLPTSTTIPSTGQVIYMAQAVPAVSVNASQQPPPYNIAVTQPPQIGYYGNQTFQNPQQKTAPNPTI